uniref:hypothetical protein n=1 Tax=Paludisphaera sp. TaxID=2017432 RepID=UPI00301D582E
MVDQAKRHTKRQSRKLSILWGGRHIQTSDLFEVPSEGIVRAEFLAATPDVPQGFDMKLDGWFQLAKGEQVPVLRTWKDDRYEDRVEYPFHSRDCRIFVWNVYEMIYPSGKRIEEKWTGNAGFWVETHGESERIYHCSHGMNNPPDFDSLVFKVSVEPR